MAGGQPSRQAAAGLPWAHRHRRPVGNSPPCRPCTPPCGGHQSPRPASRGRAGGGLGSACSPPWWRAGVLMLMLPLPLVRRRSTPPLPRRPHPGSSRPLAPSSPPPLGRRSKVDALPHRIRVRRLLRWWRPSCRGCAVKTLPRGWGWSPCSSNMRTALASRWPLGMFSRPRQPFGSARCRPRRWGWWGRCSTPPPLDRGEATPRAS